MVLSTLGDAICPREKGTAIGNEIRQAFSRCLWHFGGRQPVLGLEQQQEVERTQCEGCFGFAILSHPKRLRWAEPLPPSGTWGGPAERQSRSPGEAPACRGSGGAAVPPARLPGWQHVTTGSASSSPDAADPRAVCGLSEERRNERVTAARQAPSGRRPLSCLIMRRAGQRDRRMLFLAPRRAAEGCLCHRAHLAGMSRVSICIKQSPDPQMRRSQSTKCR